MNALAGLMNPAGIGQGIQQSFQMGVEQRRQAETRNALAAYAQNPSAEGAAMVAQHDPATGIQLGQYEQRRAAEAREQQMEAQRQQLAGRAAQGDKTALLSLWGVDWETAKSLDKYQTEKALEGYDFIANAAYQIVQLPEAQRPQAWDAYIQQGVQMGFDGLAQFQGQYNPQTLNSVVARAGEMKSYQEAQQPKYMAIPAGGTLVDTNNPQAVQQFGQAPQPGVVEDGYRFKGGNPADPNAWEPVAAGGAGSGQQGFQR
jgi:hypothetical protein